MLFLSGRGNAVRAPPCPGAFSCNAIPATGEGQAMVRSVRLCAAALIGAALVSAAEAQTPGPEATPTIHARARHHGHKHYVEQPEGRQITVHKRANATPSWLTLGPAASTESGGANYVTSTFNQPSPVEGTFTGYRGRERLQYTDPGYPLFKF